MGSAYSHLERGQRSIARITLGCFLAVPVGCLISDLGMVPVQAMQTAVQQEALPSLSVENQATQQKMVDKALRFLDGQQAQDGSFSAHAGTGPTAMVVSAMVRHGRSESHPTVAKAIAYLMDHVQADGGIYVENSTHRNYETALSVMALADLDGGKKYADQIAAADKFLRRLQWDEEEMKEPDDMAYGGAGYGSHTRPDLSNTSFMIDALKAAGAEEGDPDLQKALVFVSRCQNHESSANKTEFATAGPKDGGFFYTAAAGGESKAGTLENNPKGLRSYGSMTYAGLKSLLYAGVDKDDSRVQAAMTYLQQHYDLDSNPGVGAQGLYYYYHIFGKSLHALGEAKFKTADGMDHDWRAELISELAGRQQENGSWLNTESERWMEGDPNLVTAYALLGLSYTR